MPTRQRTPVVVLVAALTVAVQGCGGSGSTVDTAAPSSTAATSAPDTTTATTTSAAIDTTVGGAEPAADDDPEIVELPIRDDFSDPDSGWPAVESETSSTAYVDGGYLIAINAAGRWRAATRPTRVGDVVIRVEGRNAGGHIDNGFGVICRADLEADTFYAFQLASDGHYRIGKQAADEYIDLVPWTRSDIVNGGDAADDITAECIGSSLRLFANGELAAEATDGDYPSGDVGLIAASFANPDVRVLFDNFTAEEP